MACLEPLHPIFGYLVSLGLGSYTHKVGCPYTGACNEPTGRPSDKRSGPLAMAAVIMIAPDGPDYLGAYNVVPVWVCSGSLRLQ